MISAITILAVILLMAFIELPRCTAHRLTREIWGFSLITGAGVILCLFVLFDIQVASPLELIRIIYKPITSMIYK